MRQVRVYRVHLTTDDGELIETYRLIHNDDFTEENVDNFDLSVEDLPETMRWKIKLYEQQDVERKYNDGDV